MRLSPVRAVKIRNLVWNEWKGQLLYMKCWCDVFSLIYPMWNSSHFILNVQEYLLLILVHFLAKQTLNLVESAFVQLSCCRESSSRSYCRSWQEHKVKQVGSGLRWCYRFSDFWQPEAVTLKLCPVINRTQYSSIAGRVQSTHLWYLNSYCPHINFSFSWGAAKAKF